MQGVGKRIDIDLAKFRHLRFQFQPRFGCQMVEHLFRAAVDALGI